ncbi:ABC transporter ATP-binding protein [Marinilactibacillus piezotolerans]|uniref:ABC transporter ATP-binding protein n=1 Tax=Marinilactibacillus piezotolerans TaxID=258723 RepID=UPI0009B02CBB|nr:ABC transporter ATP-binding protein [Marinilactibacillus piezotolerans]
MKQKLKHLKILIMELYTFKPTIFVFMSLNVLINAVKPLLQLLLSAQVIQWLLEGIAIQEYLLNLLGWIAVLAVAELASSYFEITVEEYVNFFRTQTMFKVKKQYLQLDYPLLIGKKAQERYNEARELSYNNESLFGRLIPESIEWGTALTSVILTVSILSQLEPLFLLMIGLFMLIVLFFNRLQIKLDHKLFSAIANNTQKQRYLVKVYGESRITKDVRIFQMNNWFKRIEKNTIDQYQEILKPKQRLSWTESTVLNIGIIGLSALSYIRSVQLIVSGEIPVSSFVVFAGSVTILAQAIIQLIKASGKMNKNINETEKYDKFLTQKSRFNHGKGTEIPSGPLTIELKNVSYTYPNHDQPALKNISLIIQPYENLAIVGENGAGKSTLTNLITGLIEPDEGEILINGISQKDFNRSEYYTLFAPVFQEKYLLTYSIKETIIQGVPFDAEKYERVLKLSGMETIISQFKTKDETKIVRAVDRDGVNLSGGQLQKLKLAQALYKDAPCLILDEPTAALDPIAEHQVYQDYFQFSKDKLSIFISHRLSSTRFCDRIIYLKQGAITEIGTHDELIRKAGDYYNLYEAQAYYYKKDKVEDESEAVIEGGVI